MVESVRERPRFDEDWLVDVLDSLSEGVIALAADGRILAANPSAEDLLGFAISDLRNEPWDSLSWRELCAEDGSALTGDAHPVAATLADSEPRPVQIVGLGQGGGPTWLALATHVLPSDDPTTAGGVVVSFQDRTDRVQAEHEANRLIDVLRQFMASVTHDLRSPLTVILGHANMLASDWREMSDAERDGSVSSIVRQSEAVGRLVDDLSVVTRLEGGGMSIDPRDVDLQALVDVALDGVTELDTVDIAVPAGLTVRLDPDHGRRMLLNLVENARRYGEAPYEVTAQRAGGGIEIAVVDHGSGVPEDFVPRLFERFTRVSTRGGGTGLGLAIVAGLAQMNGGSVRYEPNVPHGSRFVLELPPA